MNEVLMQNYLFAAGVLTLLVGAVHSILGEILIFRRLRVDSIVPTNGAPLLLERHVRILWASWHVVTVLGWAFGVVLIRLSLSPTTESVKVLLENSIVYAMLASAAIVFIGTKGKHPGWIGLLGVAILTWLA
jgi:hypothetical protein